MQQWRKEWSRKKNFDRAMLQVLELLAAVGENACLAMKQHQAVQKSSS